MRSLCTDLIKYIFELIDAQDIIECLQTAKLFMS